MSSLFSFSPEPLDSHKKRSIFWRNVTLRASGTDVSATDLSLDYVMGIVQAYDYETFEKFGPSVT